MYNKYQNKKKTDSTLYQKMVFYFLLFQTRQQQQNQSNFQPEPTLLHREEDKRIIPPSDKEKCLQQRSSEIPVVEPAMKNNVNRHSKVSKSQMKGLFFIW